MPSYSSAQFYKDWRYKVEKNFTSPSGEPVSYAEDGLRTWGSERYKLPFSKSPSRASVNCDASLLAISVETDIYIYEAADFSQVIVLKGHVSQVDGLAFQPGNPKVLISSAQNDRGGSVPAEPKIIIWDLDEQQALPFMEDSVIQEIASKAMKIIAKNLQETQHQLSLSEGEGESLTSEIEPLISKIVKAHSIADKRTIHGRLTTNFQTENFSPSGAQLIYMSGDRPRSNGNDVWDIRIYSMSTHQDVFTLSGHTDSITWTGYSPDEKLIGTVSWDKSMRIWDAATGQQKHKFDTENQNWCGRFSPDSQKFVGTCGDGTLYVYSMSDGTTLVEEKMDKSVHWMRALSWSPDGRLVAVGSKKFFLYDTEKKEITQERILSTEAALTPDDCRRMLKSYLECSDVRFVDGGRKVVVQTPSDGGIETYDLETWRKWRFARPGVDAELGGEVPKNLDGTCVRGGHHMTVWEDPKTNIVWIASIDGDAVRIWNVPMTR